MKREKQQGIYLIFAKNGKCYVGQSRDLRGRINSHQCELRRGAHKNRYLQATYDKYGMEFFTFEILELVEDADDLNEREQFYIDEYDSFRNGFNLAMVVVNERTSAISKGTRHETSVKTKEFWSCPERRKKQSETHKKRLRENPDALLKLTERSYTDEAKEEFKSRMKKWRETLTPEEASALARKSAAARTEESNRIADIKAKIKKAKRWLNDILPKNNKMGYKNIYFCVHRHKDSTYLFAACRYKDWNTGKNYVRKFNVNNMGLIPAHAAASKWRDEVVTKMYLEFLRINDKEGYETTRI